MHIHAHAGQKPFRDCIQVDGRLVHYVATQAEFPEVFSRLSLHIDELRTLTVNHKKWQAELEILTPGVDFPTEHILILACKPAEAE